ncbi:putative membrane protein, partial [Chlamydia psittaci 08DC60]
RLVIFAVIPNLSFKHIAMDFFTFLFVNPYPAIKFLPN